MTQKDDQFHVDTDHQQLGVVYAKSLLQAAESAGEVDRVIEEFDSLLDDVLIKTPKLHETLLSYRLKQEQKVDLIDKAFGDKMSRTLLNFLKVVSQHNRLDCLPAIRQELRRLFNESKGRIEVHLTSAEPIDEGLTQRIVARLKEAFQAEIELNTRVDREILGGIVVRIGDTVYDGSVLNRLNQLHTEVLEQSTRQVQKAADQLTIAESA